jgi:hypothetical protein
MSPAPWVKMKNLLKNFIFCQKQQEECDEVMKHFPPKADAPLAQNS